MKRRSVVPWKGWSSTSLADSALGLIPDELYRALEGFNRGNPVAKLQSILGSKEGIFDPAIDVEDNESEIKVRAELAGMEEKDVEILLNDESLTLRGEKKTERKEDGYYESHYGSFERVIPLGVKVANDKVTAVMKSGVLTVTLPKVAGVEEDKGRKISIVAEGN